MSSLAIALTMLGCVLVGTVLALWISSHLPEYHLNYDSKELVKLSLGVVGTLTAMVLGLLISSTKGTFDSQSGTIKDLAAQMAVLDRMMSRYGQETGPARSQLRQLADSVLKQMWPADPKASIDFSGGPSRPIGEQLFDTVGRLEPMTDTQRLLKSQVQEMLTDMGKLRQKLLVNDERSIPAELLIVLGVWQVVLFAGFGLLTPRNTTSIAVLLISILSVTGAVFIVMELDRPFAGTIRVSDAPLRAVISHLGD